MADDGSFSRSSTICFFLILMLSEVIGIRTGDHVFTRRNLLQLLNDQGLTKVSLLMFFYQFHKRAFPLSFFYLCQSFTCFKTTDNKNVIFKNQVGILFFYFLNVQNLYFQTQIGMIVSFIKFIFTKSEKYTNISHLLFFYS